MGPSRHGLAANGERRSFRPDRTVPAHDSTPSIPFRPYQHYIAAELSPAACAARHLSVPTLAWRRAVRLRSSNSAPARSSSLGCCPLGSEYRCPYQHASPALNCRENRHPAVQRDPPAEMLRERSHRKDSLHCRSFQLPCRTDRLPRRSVQIPHQRCDRPHRRSRLLRAQVRDHSSRAACPC
jgi:hypothetical protein